MEFETLLLLSMGFGFGLLHALDADHVIAVSSLSNEGQPGSKPIKRTLTFCARWAIGHGGILCVLAAALLAFNVSVPSWVHIGAEKLVGIILIVLGVWIFWQLKVQRVELRIHSHGDHVHTHLADETHAHKGVGDHGPVLVGITHGLAGSAPVLALLPSLELASQTWGFVYVLLFSLGVLCMMFCFGLGLGFAQSKLLKVSQRLFEFSRALIAAISVGFGTYWLLG